MVAGDWRNPAFRRRRGSPRGHDPGWIFLARRKTCRAADPGTTQAHGPTGRSFKLHAADFRHGEMQTGHRL